MKRLFIIGLIITVTHGFPSAQEIKFHVINTFHIKSPGGWDYIAVGPANNRLYVSHSTQVNILDQTSGDSLGVILNTTGVHGIAFDPSQNKGFTSNGRLNNVTVFNLTSNEVIGQIPTGQNPDAILYEPFIKKIITCNGTGKNLSIIDPLTNTLIDSIAVGGKPEAAASDGAGKLYVNVEDKSEIVQVDLQARKVIAHWPVAPGEEPTGLIFDKVTNRLFAACSNKLLIVIDASSGKRINSLPIGDGCDGVGFDAVTNHIFTSNGEGTLSIFHESGDLIEKVSTVPTKKGARTIAVDSQHHLIYLPTAEFENSGSVAPGGRPKMIPGTFQVLVIGQ